MRQVNNKGQEFFVFRDVKFINSRRAISKKMADILDKGRYEHSEIDLVLENVEEDDIILELGAGIGAISSIVLIHKQVKNYVCVEANPQLIPLIKKNHKINDITSCEVIHGVMSNDAAVQEFDFYLCNDFWASSLRKPLTGHSQTIKVQGYNFSECLRRYQPSFIICDIEGGEFALFTDGVDLSSVQKICIEVHSSSARELLDLYAFFVDQGFYLLSNPPFKGVVFLGKKPI